MRHLVSLLFVGVSLLFLAGCAGGEGGGSAIPTTKTQSGYPYKFVVDNDGPVISEGQYAYFHYTRRLDDSVMDGSRAINQKPKLKLPPADQIGAQPNPLIEGLSLMSVGDSLTVSVDLDSIPNIPPNLKKYDFMHIDIVLESIKSEEEYQADIAAEQAEQAAAAEITKARLPEVESLIKTTLADYNSNKLGDKIQTTASGLKYLIHEEGTGEPTANGERISAHYYGSLLDGKRFDDSFSRGSPFQFPLGGGQVIRGWDEGFALFKHGTKASLFVPADLGYGERGSPPTIPPNSELHFYVELQ
ncbi:MAG: FKBP-type peptidyl-prolyl cis-trans isomerase [Bacteroidota bacterium]